MIDLQVTSPGMDAVIERLYAVRERLADLRWLADELAVVLRETTEAALRAGIDRDGVIVAELSPETVKRRARAGRGQGPARVPDEASRFLTNIQVDVIQLNSDTWRVTLSWPGVPFLRYHIEGTGHMPARNPVGITPDGRARIEETVRAAIPRILGTV